MIIKKLCNFLCGCLPLLIVLYGTAFSFQKTNAADFIINLSDNWQVQTSNKVKENGTVISTPQYVALQWYKTGVPTTVLSALVKNGVYRDIFFGKNLDSIPKEQFNTSWWYRTEFTLKNLKDFPFIRLIFEGINYRATVFLNGERIGSADSLYCAFRMFEIDITKFVTKGKNVLAVEVFPPRPGDFTMGFVDWNPPAPDHNMGLFRPVKIRLNKAVSINSVFVKSTVNTKSLAEAELTISALLTNHSNTTVSGTVKGEIEKLNFTRSFLLKPYENKEIQFDAKDYQVLRLHNPLLWWPNNLGEPNLHQLKLSAQTGAQVSDVQTVTFGIREVSDYINEKGYRGYIINGKKILLRGGGWADDLLLDEDEMKLEAQIKYVKHMNLNTIRLEGFWGSSQLLYELADRYGILVMPGWSCQWEWENSLGKQVDNYGGIQTPEDMELAVAMLHDQVLWLRNHPSIFVWVLGSDKLPRPELEQKYTVLLSKIDTTRPRLMSCASRTSTVSGPTGVKMNGPYEYVTPNYWYLDTRSGGAFGFNTETGPGPQPPPLESLKKMIPEDQLWPINDMWNYHCARGQFNKLDRYLVAFNNRYEKSASVEEFAFHSQAANYEAIRAMFEAFGANKPTTTGIIQWMLNSAWPKLFWQLYDYYLMPGGAFYGVRKSSQPVTLVYHYGNNSIYLVNDLFTPIQNATAVVQVFNMESKKVFAQNIPVDAEENSSKKILELPEYNDSSPVYFLNLQLKRVQGAQISGNFYWLSVKQDSLDERRANWYSTSNKAFADFTPLKNLPLTAIKAEHQFKKSGKEYSLSVTVSNPTDKIAFFIELQVVKNASRQSVLPIFWDDNYISLLPGEQRIITAHFSQEDLGNEKPIFQFRGWNIENK